MSRLTDRPDSTDPTPIRLLPSDLPAYGPDTTAYRLETPYKDAEYAVRIRGTDTYYVGYKDVEYVFRLCVLFPEGLFTHKPAPAPVAKKLVPTEHRTWYTRYPVYKCEPPAPMSDGSTTEYVAQLKQSGRLVLCQLSEEGWDWFDRNVDLTGYDLSAVKPVSK